MSNLILYNNSIYRKFFIYVSDDSTCFTNDMEFGKSFINSENDMGIYTRMMFAFLKSETWIRFLEGLTGIENLIPDPKYFGSGIHMTSGGGKLNIHADFNRLGKLHRRVNTFLFLNEDWNESFGGHLEFWNREMNKCEQRILPTFGRFVVFSTTDFSYHGHPHPLTCPKGRVRRSLALYYYTQNRPSDECIGNDCSTSDHGTLFQTPKGCSKCTEQICKKYEM